MVQEITKYPQTPSIDFGANIRSFDETLFTLIQDLKDTIEANDLQALSAFQIGSPYSVILVKEGDEFLEFINARVIKRDGTVETTEKTAYFPNLTAKTKRYEKIKLMYEDREGKQQFSEYDGELSITIQRKLDYNFGSNFRVRLSEDERKIFDAKLEFGTDSITQNDCPTVFKRDRILQLFKILLIAGFAGLFISLFVSEAINSTITTVENYILIALSSLIVIYFFYAQYEGKQYKHCTSCQIGNIIGTTVILLFKLLILLVSVYFIVW
ncbi:MAG: peptide deformylase [Sulfurovum sp.]